MSNTQQWSVEILLRPQALPLFIFQVLNCHTPLAICLLEINHNQCTSTLTNHK